MLFVNFLLPLFSGETIIKIPVLTFGTLVIVIYGLIVRRVRHTARRAQRTNLAMVSWLIAPSRQRHFEIRLILKISAKITLLIPSIMINHV